MPYSAQISFVWASASGGTVRFVSETINLNIWQALCTPKAAPGEVVGGQF